MTKPLALRRGQRFLDLASGKLTHDPDLSKFRVYLPDGTCALAHARVDAAWANAVVEQIDVGWKIVGVFTPGHEPAWSGSARYERRAAERIG